MNIGSWRFARPAQPEFLFPSTAAKNRALSTAQLGKSIRDVIEEHVGIVMNPHLFRAFAARLILERSPGALEDVRLLLGDKTLHIILAHYAAIKPSHAAGRYYELLRKSREENTHLVERAKPVRRKALR